MFFATSLFLALSGFGILWFLLPFALRKQAENEIRDFCREHGLLVLTFDDGPCPVTTPPVLELLARHKVSASFFALGQNLQDEPGLAAAVKQAGHDLGNHSFHHRNAWKSLPGMDILDLRAAGRVLSQKTWDTNLYRPPYGKVNLAGWLYIKARHIVTCWWTIDPRDSLEHPISADDVIDLVRQQNGGVVLLHDNDRYPDPEHKQYVLDLVDRCVKTAKETGIEILPYSGLIARMEMAKGKTG